MVSFSIGSGTGFIVEKIQLFTNKHVVAGMEIGAHIIAHPNGEYIIMAVL